MDALVAEGIMMERSYVFMYCAPTRSSIMSGRTPFRVNQILFGMNEPDWDMPSEMTAMPKKMKLGGYATAHYAYAIFVLFQLTLLVMQDSFWKASFALTTLAFLSNNFGLDFSENQNKSNLN